MKKVISILLIALMAIGCIFIAGCGNENTTESNSSSQTGNTSKTEKIGGDQVGVQLEMPEKGEEIAILHTNYGDITWRFFPEFAPKTVENFIGLAKDGKYDNTIFHRVINDFMIQGGDYENSNGTGGTSYFGSAFEDEFSSEILNIRGSVAMANSGKNTNGSQFFINQSGVPDGGYNWSAIQNQCDSIYNQIYTACNGDETQMAMYFKSNYTGLLSPDMMSDEAKALYEQNGGNYFLDGAFNKANLGHTVFAQVIDGMDVVDKIAAVEVDSSSNKPLEDVIIESVEIKKYEG